jgi:hypothetical protein
MTNEEIVRRAISLLNDDGDESPIDPMDAGLIMIALNLLEGKKYALSSGDPDSIDRARSLAEHLGASVEAGKHTLDVINDRTTTIVFSPAPRH